MALDSSLGGYDYIVVGAGSAGCVVARRLSDDPAVRVLLLEAGPPPSGFWMKAPAGMAALFQSEKFNWRYNTEPVPTLRNRRIYWPRGKALGGSSAVNGLVYTRGNRKDYDQWAALGNPGWSWDDVVPFFKRAERNERGPNANRGTDGPLTVSDPVIQPSAIFEFMKAASRCGIPVVDDMSSAGEAGVGVLQANILNGARQSAYDAYIVPILGRKNLEILTGVHARRVLFEQQRATGVEFQQGDQLSTVFARREVILSSGVIGSPHLLMLSGIGNGEMLQLHGIPTRVHSPGVGQNLQDHFSVHVKALSIPGSSYNMNLIGWRKYWQGLQYVVTQKGYLALPSSLAAAYFRSSPDVDYEDIQMSFRPMTFTFDDSGVAAVDPYHAMSAAVYRVRPDSRGEILLKSADPMQAPAFHPNYLQAPEDKQAMLSGIRQMRKILATEPLASLILSEMAPGAGLQTDAQLLDHMELHGKCAYHPVGTCKMGTDAMSVLDERLRVRGVEGLRVVDASVMPNVTSGNTHAPVVMIGEKGASMILADYAAMNKFA